MFRPSLYFQLSSFYFWYFAFIGAFAPYFALYLQSLGYSPLQIAALMAINPVSRIYGPNLWGWLARPPLLERGALVPDPHGMSLFLTTPFLALAAWPRRWTALEAWAAASALLCFAPSLFYYNDGWVHFGQRFALDGIAPALLAAHGGARRAPPWLVVALTVWGVAVGAWGLQWFRASFLH